MRPQHRIIGEIRKNLPRRRTGREGLIQRGAALQNRSFRIALSISTFPARIPTLSGTKYPIMFISIFTFDERKGKGKDRSVQWAGD